jgi:uncharacterized protein YoaH (UPF0181 family)
MTDTEYISITFQIGEVFDNLRPLTHEEQLEQTGIRCREAIRILAQIMEELLTAESNEDRRPNISHRAIDIQPSLN